MLMRLHDVTGTGPGPSMAYHACAAILERDRVSSLRGDPQGLRGVATAQPKPAPAGRPGGRSRTSARRQGGPSVLA